jgi:hypothetical protein
MTHTTRVEWIGADPEGVEHAYSSHDMPRADAEAFAAVVRQSETVRGVTLIERADG